MRIFKNKIIRIDIFNRILIILVMVLFLIIPSYELYHLETNTNGEKILNLVNIIFLISLIGNGILAIYKPVRISWFFFFDILFMLLFYNDAILSEEIRKIIEFDILPLYVTEVVIASIGLFLNLVYLVYFLRKKKKYKFEYKEYTNSDSFYDFLNGRDSNKKIEKEIESIDDGNKIIKIIKKIKFSKLLRIVSYLFFVIVFFIYLFRLTSKAIPGQRIIDNIVFYPLISAIVISTILFIGSLFFPKDYKYCYYFNLFIYLISLFFSCKQVEGLSPVLIAVSIFLTASSLIITMITEGRTWMGARYDD